QTERASAYGLKAALLSRGYQVDLAHEADDAVHIARDRRPELIVVDQELTEVGGLQLMDILRHDPDTQSIPILALCEPEQGLRVARAGADASLSKPFDTSSFIASIQRLISGVREGRRVLIVDSDREFRAMCAKALSHTGFVIGEAGEPDSALERAVAFRPDLILLEVELPGQDGFGLFRSLRAESATAHSATIFVSSRSDTQNKVRALRMGGEDYLVKPLDPMELAARAEMVLRRREDEVTASPTTRLPGGVTIEREIVRRIEGAASFALCYLDLDNLKAFNDYYGYAKADGVIRQTGDLLREAIARLGGEGDFLGHIAGDDFVFITNPDRVDTLCQEIVEAFDRVIPLYYSREDRRRGFIETEDRYGHLRRFPVMSVSIAVVTDPGGVFQSHSELSSVAAELKKRAKAVEGSCVVRDDVLRRNNQVG
ncbi:MAG: response regulator, partial [Myxococcota bacterium]